MKENPNLEEAMANPQNLGEMADADSVGTVGSPDCGDMLRMWIKFDEKDGKKVIDKASFQSFGCQTAMAVASVATEMIKGKTPEEALEMSATDLSEPLGPLPPMKVHCGQLVETALKDALGNKEEVSETNQSDSEEAIAPSLVDSIGQSQPGKKIKIVKLDP